MFQYGDKGEAQQNADPQLPVSKTQLLNPSNRLFTSNHDYSFKSHISTGTMTRPLHFPQGYRSSFARPSPEIIQPVNSRAIEYFLSLHTFRECGFPRGYYEYLSVFVNGVGTSRPLVTSLSAVALAAYAYTCQSSDLLKEARRQYGHALRLVGIALSSHEETIRSSTLSSVLLLSTFDTITGEDENALVPRASHMIAAMSILGRTGYALVNSSTCLQLMLHVCWSLLQTCITCSYRVPDDVMYLRKHAASALDTNDPAWKLFNIIVKVANFRADIKESFLADRDRIVHTALNIDSELASLASTMPVEWNFKSIAMKEMSELVFGTCYHVYPDQWVAHIWNSLRVSRLLLHNEIRRALTDKPAMPPRSFSDTDELNYETSSKVLHQMIWEVCATVPQYSGYLGMLANDRTLNKIPYSSQSNSSSDINSLTNGIPTTAGVYLILFPLLCAGQMTESDRQRRWIIERSRYIGELTGIQQAFVYADSIERKEKI